MARSDRSGVLGAEKKRRSGMSGAPDCAVLELGRYFTTFNWKVGALTVAPPDVALTVIV